MTRIMPMLVLVAAGLVSAAAQAQQPDIDSIITGACDATASPGPKSAP